MRYTLLFHTIALFCGGTAHAQSMGSLDPDFASGTGFTAVNALDRTVTTIVVQPDNKILVGGGFNAYNGTARNRIARLNSNGSLDASFSPGTGFDNGIAFRQVLAIALQPDGRMWVGARFDSFNGLARNGLVRLEANGSTNVLFGISGFIGLTYVYAIAVQPDGKVLLAGQFNNYKGHACSNIIRIDASGSFDPSFQPGTGTNDVIYTMQLQQDGRILLGGAFTTCNGVAAGRAVRLLPDGAVDTTFATGVGFNGAVHSIAYNPASQSILMGGSFTQYKGLARYRVVRLNNVGSYVFSWPPEVNSVVRSVAFCPPFGGGEVIIGGRFTSYTEESSTLPVGRIARLFNDGLVDPVFDSYPGFNEVAPFEGVQALAITPEGDVIAGGTFSSYKGTPVGGIAKLLNHCLLDGGPCDDGDANTINDVYDGHCVCQGTYVPPGLVVLEFQGDANAPAETSFEILEQGTLNAVCAGQVQSPGGTQHDCMLADGCYELRVYDSGGDGMVGGGYLLRTGLGRRIIDNRGNFTSGSLSAIANNGGFCLPLGNDRLIGASTDRMDLRRNVNSSCSDRITADNTPNSTAGNVYQFWFYDPNGMLSLVYPSANGATGNQVSMSALPSLVEGELYNVRVRTRISAGVWREWGPASRMMIDNAAGQCPQTSLQDEPNNTHLSCGQTLPLGSGAASLVYAKPKTRWNANCAKQHANKYQFRFRIPAQGIVIVKNGVGNHPWTYLNMANVVDAPLPGGVVLQACTDYAVDVRASFDGGITWCSGGDPYADLAPWGQTCIVSTDGCTGAMPQEGTEAKGNGDQPILGPMIFPNPNRGDRFHVSFDPSEVDGGLLSVAVYDGFGRCVLTRSTVMQQGQTLALIDCDGVLASGVYSVVMTMGRRTSSARLVIQP